MIVLGLESSCDETAAAVVRDGCEVLSNVVFSQVDLHRLYGGVVPEIASRSHVEVVSKITDEAIQESGLDWSALDGVAVTHGPGLAPALLVGVTAAKSIALRLSKPLMGINHLEAHLYSLFLSQGAIQPSSCFPMIVLLVTGGHTCLVRIEALGSYRVLGETLDDAAGEALDKAACLLGLGYPGGPAIEAAACGYGTSIVPFPHLMSKKNHSDDFVNGMLREYCFSFSGLKTSLLYQLKSRAGGTLGQKEKGEFAAGFQQAVFNALLDRTKRALDREGAKVFGCVGGVAKNKTLRGQLNELCSSAGVKLLVAPLAYCTDNAAMVAALAGAKNWDASNLSMSLDVAPNLALG